MKKKRRCQNITLNTNITKQELQNAPGPRGQRLKLAKITLLRAHPSKGGLSWGEPGTESRIKHSERSEVQFINSPWPTLL